MNKILSSLSLVLLANTAFLATTSFAADLPRKSMPVKSVYAPAPISSWEGSYFGGHVGYAFHGLGKLDPSGVNIDVKAVNGGFGGVQAGYLWQTGGFVYGAQVDASLSNIRGNNSGLASPTIVLNPVGALTGRVGFAFNRELLVYGLAGVTLGRVKVADGLTNPTSTRFAPTVGAGAEYRFTKNWSAFGEFRYADYGSWSAASLKNMDTRVGVNYRF